MAWYAVAFGLVVFGLCLWLRNTPYPDDDADEQSWGLKNFHGREPK